MARKKVTLSRAGLFSSTTITDVVAPSGKVNGQTMSELSGSVSTGSFDLSSPGSALKSTQQIPVDWSRFEKHTFFDSAESKVNVAFDSIINYFPFDGMPEDVTTFLDGLTGYERYIFDSKWPKYSGYLHFSGTAKNEDPANGYSSGLGTHISTTDQAGHLYPTISKRRDGAPVIDFNDSPFSCTFHINIPDRANESSIITQKLLNGHGFSVFLSKSDSSSPTAKIIFAMSSGSMAISASADFDKSTEKFQHCAAIFTKRQNQNSQLLIYKDGVLAATSSQTLNLGPLNFKTANLNIGSGSNHYLGNYSTTLEQFATFSGSLDDFRLYSKEKNKQQIADICSGSSKNSSDMLVFYRFNESTGSYTNNNVVLDHSGNSLHSTVTNYFAALRDKSAGGRNLTNPMVNEDIKLCPVLFPSQQDVVALNQILLASASNYDANNPNLITRMIPRHYLEEEATAMGYDNARAGLGEAYSSTLDFPGGGDPGSPQLIASLLFMWAKLFDELKLFIDHFGRLFTVNYEDLDTVADVMIPFFAQYYGISLPNMFSDATIDQYVRGKNIKVDASVSDMSLAKIQAVIWKRILLNIQDAIRSKGTIHGIKSIMRATGINPDTMFRFRESGGPVELDINNSRIFRNETSGMLKFSNSSMLVSPFLSGSRTEVGTPLPRGTMVEKNKYPPHGISDNESDGLFTSRSWSVEFIVKPKLPKLISSMSLSRVCTTGTAGTITLANCVGVGTTKDTIKTGSLSVFHRPVGASSTSEAIELVLTGTDVFDGSVWHVSYGRRVVAAMTSSYFIRAGKQNEGDIVEWREKYLTASFGTDCLYSYNNDTSNASGSFLQFGSSGSISTFDAGLNKTGITSHAKVINFSGSLGRIRFWSKALTSTEDKEHVRNVKSVGVEDPLLNFGFVNNKTGSFERLRIDAQCDQQVTESNGSGEISIFDYSQNLFHMSGTSFPVSKKVIHPQDFRFSTLNTKFDERSVTNKIRIAGYLEDSNVELFNSLKAPVRSIPLGTPVEDDTRFSIEVSNVKALNDDIILLLGSLEFFNEALGSPELMFASDYPNVSALRQVYFNRLTDKINNKNLVSFYKWIDDTIGFLINRMIPSNTSFLGMNFVIESHMLERNKLRYLQEDIYLGENDRRGLQTDLNLQQVVGHMKRY